MSAVFALCQAPMSHSWTIAVSDTRKTTHLVVGVLQNLLNCYPLVVLWLAVLGRRGWRSYIRDDQRKNKTATPRRKPNNTTTEQKKQVCVSVCSG